VKQKGIKTRACSKCGGDLSDRHKKQRYCKKCHAEWMRDNRVKYSDLTDEQRKKIKARSYANVYLKRGIIKRQYCLICGDNAEMHHDDYSKPLEIKWLCRKHHLDLHNESNCNL